MESPSDDHWGLSDLLLQPILCISPKVIITHAPSSCHPGASGNMGLCWSEPTWDLSVKWGAPLPIGRQAQGAGGRLCLCLAPSHECLGLLGVPNAAVTSQHHSAACSSVPAVLASCSRLGDMGHCMCDIILSHQGLIPRSDKMSSSTVATRSRCGQVCEWLQPPSLPTLRAGVSHHLPSVPYSPCSPAAEPATFTSAFCKLPMSPLLPTLHHGGPARSSHTVGSLSDSAYRWTRTSSFPAYPAGAWDVLC